MFLPSPTAGGRFLSENQVVLWTARGEISVYYVGTGSDISVDAPTGSAAAAAAGSGLSSADSSSDVPKLLTRLTEGA